jgi:hypothetical protein
VVTTAASDISTAAAYRSTAGSAMDTDSARTFADEAVVITARCGIATAVAYASTAASAMPPIRRW